ncbi:hypothetical protein MMC28_001284 [Mycoblastus sanguinarius]|nr:hypothetical protein [Mycoblastus sanguinarius]
MPKWEEPETPGLLQGYVILPGHGLGVIDSSEFEPATWEDKLTYTMGRRQYGQFVAAIVERIRAGESGPDEVHKFTKLLETEPNWDFLTVAVPHVPELKGNYPIDPKHPELALLFHQMRQKLHQRKNFHESEGSVHNPLSNSYENGLNKEEKALLRHNMFGPDVGAKGSESMKRLFKSTLELGFPQDERVAKASGEDMYRDHQGLPCDLRMPDPPGQPTEVAGSSPRSQTPGSSAGPTRVGPSSTIHNDCPHPDLLAEKEFEDAIRDSKSRVQRYRKQLHYGWPNTVAAPGNNLPPHPHILCSPP